MKIAKFTKDKIAVSYKGASVFATGNLAKVITVAVAGLFIMCGIAAIQNAFKKG